MEKLQTINYSDKAIAVIGKTKEYKDQLKNFGGRFNPFLTINGTKQAGWIFSKKRSEDILSFIESLNGQTFKQVCNECNFELPTKIQTEQTPINVIVTPPVIQEQTPTVTHEPEPIVQEQRQVETEQKPIETPKMKQVIKQIASKFKVNFKGIFNQFKKPNSIPILDYAKVFENGTIHLSDLDTNVMLGNYFVNKTNGTICLPIAQITGVDNNLHLEIEPNGTGAKLGQFKMSGMLADDFPLYCPIETKFKQIGTLDKTAIETVQIAVDYTGKDDLRPIYSSVYFDKTNGNVVSTDAHKLFYKQAHNLTESFNMNVKTAKLLGMLSDSYEVFISECYQYIKLVSNNGTIVSRLIEGNYPNYMAVIPTNNDKKFIVDKVKLVKVVNEALKCANKDSKQVRFTFAKDSVIVSSNDIDLATEYSCEIQAQSSVDFEIGFNGKFLLSILANISETEITFDCSEHNRAALINTDFLLMPVMIKE